MIKKILIGAGGVFVLLVAIGLMMQKSSGGGTTVVKRDYFYQGKYISFPYDPKYKLETVPTADGRVSTYVRLFVEGAERPRMMVLLRGAMQELDELPEVQEKRRDSLMYIEEVARMKGMRGVLFFSADRKERTAFFKKGNQLLIVVLTADSAEQKWTDEFQKFVDNIEWRI